MSQLYEKKCDCKYYDELNDHSATLLKMELPEYEAPSSSSGYIISRALRFIGYITVAVLLSYSLWRIHVIESHLLASDHLHNLTRTIALESSRLHHSRVARSVPVGHHADVNSIGSDKDLPRGAMLSAKNEFVQPKRRRPADEREFTYLVSSLFDKIQKMHNDSDRTHLHDNMKEVFQAWFPVFDALLPEELVEDQLESLTGTIKSANDRVERSVKEEDNVNNKDWHKIERNFAISEDKMNLLLTHMRRIPASAEENRQNFIKESSDKQSDVRVEQFSNDDEEDIPRLEDVIRNKSYSKVNKKHRLVRSIVRSITGNISDESSEEQAETKTLANKTSEESSEEKKPRATRSAADKTSEESSEEKKPKPTRFERSISSHSDESKSSSPSLSSSEEQKRRVKYNKINKSKESSEEKEKKKDNSKKNEKSSEESRETSESSESKEKKKENEKNELFYQVVSSDQDGTKTIVQLN